MICNIALIPGDGIGSEVVPRGVRVLKALGVFKPRQAFSAPACIALDSRNGSSEHPIALPRQY